ncbi:MAG: sulfur carrier protein ThiS [Candidatus Cloacimonetes bacterium]|jgi:sulfur carrier protein|nr:sulfur carrier protein ThiS [Candidatus Cloacimonadota bacterium]MBT4333038.1 sulfur carrier protein ThiS [Candidatus Cloacimonadota bacterium]MBT4576100.1 sulfur carrier protein ThiS [Candidatus Cloacimonadota bacterium]MBT5419661.1 sulfur carrier protein ThiS [Candidatus Cloacimonadota bacterium]
MIKVNSNEIPWKKGLTVEKLLRENNFLIHLCIVKINGQLINKKSFATQIIGDCDDIKIVHLVAGG